MDGYDPDRGVKVVGHRGYFLKKWGVFLNQCVSLVDVHLPRHIDAESRAIINYGLEFLSERDFVPLQTPQLMLKEQMAKTAQLSQYVEPPDAAVPKTAGHRYCGIVAAFAWLLLTVVSRFDEELYKVTGDQADKYLIAVCHFIELVGDIVSTIPLSFDSRAKC